MILSTFGNNYLLTPKVNTEQVTNFQFILSELKLNNVIENEIMSVFSVHQEYFEKYKHTLNYFFDIEEDQIVSINNNIETFDVNVAPVPWHLDRIGRRHLPLQNSYNFSSKGSCHMNTDAVQIDTYIVDTGIDISHLELSGRASWGMNFADSMDVDCNSHGTHVSGIVGSNTFGVCKDANLIAVKVLDCNGSGSFSGILKGLDWVYKQHVNKQRTNSQKRVKSIINMSLGGGYSRMINNLVDSLISRNEDFYIVVAAGNEDQDACSTSPASAESVLTVMASDKDDERAWFSNWGACTDIYAPGVDIMSSVPNNKVATYSGTSMSSPLMVGVLNHYLDMYPDMNMKDIKSKLKKTATKNVISGTKKNTKNDLVYLKRSL